MRLVRNLPKTVLYFDSSSPQGTTTARSGDTKDTTLGFSGLLVALDFDFDLE
jgi:hypothetical protein